MLTKNVLAELVLLAEPRRLEPARALQAQVETADPSEQGTDTQAHDAGGKNWNAPSGSSTAACARDASRICSTV